jgi:hypothetical protein
MPICIYYRNNLFQNDSRNTTVVRILGQSPCVLQSVSTFDLLYNPEMAKFHAEPLYREITVLSLIPPHPIY